MSTVEQAQFIFDPVARHTDPDTSHAAAATVAAGNGALVELIVATVVASRFPVTAEQIADRILTECGGRWRWSSIVTAVTRVARARRICVATALGVTASGCKARTYIAMPATAKAGA